MLYKHLSREYCCNILLTLSGGFNGAFQVLKPSNFSAFSALIIIATASQLYMSQFVRKTALIRFSTCADHD